MYVLVNFNYIKAHVKVNLYYPNKYIKHFPWTFSQIPSTGETT